MDSYTWFELTKNLQLVLFSISALVNSTLLLLIIFKSPHRIGSYRYLMMTFSSYCVAFSGITMLAEPTSVARGQVYIIFSKRENPNIYDPWKHYLVCTVASISTLTYARYCMYSTSLGVLMYLISVQFFYRFCLICKPQFLRLFHGKNLLIWYLGMILVGCNWMFLTRILANRTPEMEDVMRETLESEFHIDINQVEFIGIQFFIKTSKTLAWNTKTLLLILNVAILMSAFGSVTVYCAVKTYEYSKREMENTEHNDSFNNQIFVALVTQSCIPLIFMFLPITLLIIIPLFDLSPKLLVQISAVSISIYPILDPLAVLFIVSTYRKCLFDCFRPSVVSAWFRKTCSVVDEDFDMDIL